KSALNSWTVHLAYELRDTAIKVNTVHPGYVKTDMNGGGGEIEPALCWSSLASVGRMRSVACWPPCRRNSRVRCWCA
ncbi:SDR family oxidoreductase, partial [Xanthomonas perforans]